MQYFGHAVWKLIFNIRSEIANRYVLSIFPSLSTTGLMEEPSFSSVFFTLSAVGHTVLFWCQHSVVIRRINCILCVFGGSVGGIHVGCEGMEEKEQGIQAQAGMHVSRWTV